MQIVMHELANSLDHLPEGSVAIGPTSAHEWIELTLGVRRAQRLTEPTAWPRRRPAISRRELGAAHGADPEAMDKVRAFAQQHRLILKNEVPLAARVSVSGRVADLSAAFGVKLVSYTHPEMGQFRARTGPVHLLPGLVGAVTGVFGFNDYRILRRSPLASRPELPKGRTARCIGLLEFGGAIGERDIAAFFHARNEPAPAVTLIDVGGGWHVPNLDTAAHVAVDVEAASSGGGSPRVAVYFSSCDAKGLVDGVARVVEDDVNAPEVVCINWSSEESQPIDGHIVWSPATIEHVNDSFLALAHLGVTVCVASDEGVAREGHAHVSFPANSPYVVALGAAALFAPRVVPPDEAGWTPTSALRPRPGKPAH
jgi:kumamolisin